MNICILAHRPEEMERMSAILSGADVDCRAFNSLPDLLDHLGHSNCAMLIAVLPALGSDVVAGLRAVREQLDPDTPTLLIAATTDQESLMAALSAGASDYLLLPLRGRELLARMQILLKRAYPTEQVAATLTFGPYAFDMHTCRALVSGVPVALTHKEFELALLFFQNLGRPLSRAYILDVLWPGNPEMLSRTLDTHVSRVRNKLALGRESRYQIVPVYSYGYRLEEMGEEAGRPG